MSDNHFLRSMWLDKTNTWALLVIIQTYCCLGAFAVLISGQVYIFLFFIFYCRVAILIDHNTCLAHTCVSLSVRTLRAPNSKIKRRMKTKIDVNVSQSRSSRCAKSLSSKVQKVPGECSHNMSDWTSRFLSHRPSDAETSAPFTSSLCLDDYLRQFSFQSTRA